MSSKKLHTVKASFVHLDDSLEKYKGKVLFPEKLRKANEMLKTIGLPRKKK